VNKSLSYNSVGIKTNSGIGIIKRLDSVDKANVNNSNDTGNSDVGNSETEDNSNQMPNIDITYENLTTHSDGAIYYGAEVLGGTANYADSST